MTMDWTDILTALIGVVSGGGLTALFTVNAARRKAGSEADNMGISGLNSAIDMLSKTLDAEQADNADMRTQLTDLQDKVAELRGECTTKGYYMCVHLGCPCRKPTLGRGKEFYKEHSKEDSFGADYTPINDLIDEYVAGKKSSPSSSQNPATEPKNASGGPSSATNV